MLFIFGPIRWNWIFFTQAWHDLMVHQSATAQCWNTHCIKPQDKLRHSCISISSQMAEHVLVKFAPQSTKPTSFTRPGSTQTLSHWAWCFTSELSPTWASQGFHLEYKWSLQPSRKVGRWQSVFRVHHQNIKLHLQEINGGAQGRVSHSLLLSHPESP